MKDREKKIKKYIHIYIFKKLPHYRSPSMRRGEETPDLESGQKQMSDSVVFPIWEHMRIIYRKKSLYPI